MTRQILIALLFFLSLTVEVSLIHAFHNSLAFFPFHFTVGIIVLHRAGDELGALWFIATALLMPVFGFSVQPMLVNLIAAVAGPLLTSRVFTTRSVYALEGLGISLFGITTVVNLVLHFFSQPFILGQQFFTLIFLIIGLYIGFFLSRFIERLSAQFIILEKVRS